MTAETPDKPEEKIELELKDSIDESPAELLEKVGQWAAKGGKIDFSSPDGLRHVLAESRDRSAMFMSILAVQRMRRLAKLVGATELLEERLLDPETINNMDTEQLLFTLRTLEAVTKDAIAFVNGVVQDNATGAQVLINMVDARTLNLEREDVPSPRSRDNIRQAVGALLEQFGDKIRNGVHPVGRSELNRGGDRSSKDK